MESVLDEYTALISAAAVYLFYWMHRFIIDLMYDGPMRTTYQSSIRLMPWLCVVLVAFQIASWVLNL